MISFLKHFFLFHQNLFHSLRNAPTSLMIDIFISTTHYPNQGTYPDWGTVPWSRYIEYPDRGKFPVDSPFKLKFSQCTLSTYIWRFNYQHGQKKSSTLLWCYFRGTYLDQGTVPRSGSVLYCSKRFDVCTF